MKRSSVRLGLLASAVALAWTSRAIAQNQTTNTSPILSSNNVPFTVQIDQAPFSLPDGLQSFVVGTYMDKWLLLAGRINGLHGFNPGNNNFPPDTQNTTVFVVDVTSQTVATASLTNQASGLTQAQIDLLSVTAPQFFQSRTTLYVAGGYGIDTATTNFTTKPALTAINIPGLIHWVTAPTNGETAAQYIRQTFNPLFQITGGAMLQPSPKHALLVFGQDFEGAATVTSDGTYSEQVRQFRIVTKGTNLSIVAGTSLPATPNPDFRRASLNVVPIFAHGRPSYAAFSGGFTPTDGIWTIPVEISAKGVATETSPTNATTFMQAMNNWTCPTLELYSQKQSVSYSVLMGGISYGFFSGTNFETDPELPFINQVTTITRNKQGVYSQSLINAQYPVILSTGSNPGNQLLFGANAVFIPAPGLPVYKNGVLKYDKLGANAVLVGYIVGGIQSTLPNTDTESDSAASPYIFTVTLVPTVP
ncbi:MAG TPA: hypothetical protein VMP11_06215 [Verrucomicrobiae bacterium]|nr:hypothetical protein [Verrucomicrobiae bacterium]